MLALIRGAAATVRLTVSRVPVVTGEDALKVVVRASL